MMSREAALGISRLPGNTPWESALLQEWIRQEGGAPYVGFDFNVRLGTGLDPGPAFPDSIRQGSILNTQKRIDCLAFAPEGAFMVEGKIVLDLPAMGQFLGYHHILTRDGSDLRILGYIAVAHAATPDTVGFLRSQGVQVFLYPKIQAPA